MKLTINKPLFLKSWAIAEKVVNLKSPLDAIAGILVDAEDGIAKLIATDLKTGVNLIPEGVTVESPGSEVFPINTIG
ncbi:MAG: DNA polymerase III subunit beta, partial [Spirochaetia bacterium]|nr:DNA polymerase III subunit beta [Spirochaetia bacterium]